MLLFMPSGDTYLSSRSYSRRGYSVPRFYDDTYVPRYTPHRQFLDITGEENAIRKSVNRELMLTSHFVDDAYDLANSSHKRDEEILKHASQAIVDTELYHNPRAAVASRRARSQPPQPLQVTQSVYRARASVPPRGFSPPPRSYVRRANREAALVGSKVDVVLPKHKRPKSKYAASVIREINLRKHLHGDEVTAEPEIPTSHLHASPRPVTKSKDDDYKPMSDVRRRVRRVICKNRRDPLYFK